MSSNLTSYKVLGTQRQYLKLIAANVVNRFGDSLDAVAFSWLVYQITNSASMMALIIAINYIPTILLQPVAGVLVDRMSKRRVMVLCDIGRGIVVLLTALLFWSGAATTPLIALFVILNSTLEALRVPAGVAIVPKILDEDKYTLGSGLNGTLSHICEIVGLALAGPVIRLIGTEGALMIDAVTFFGSAFFIGLIRLREELQKGKIDLSGIKSGFIEGFIYLKGKKLLWAVLMLGMMLNFTMVPFSTFATPYIVDFIKAGAEMLSAVQIALVAGMALGSFITPKITRFSNKTLLVFSGFFSAAVFVVVGLIPGLSALWQRNVALIISLALMGIGVGIINVIFSAAFMRHTDKEYMGRMGGISNALLCGAMPLAALLCSAAAALFTVPQVMLVTAGFIAVLYLVVGTMKIYREL